MDTFWFFVGWVGGMITPFLATAFSFLNIIWKSYVRDKGMQYRAKVKANDKLDIRQLRIEKILTRKKGKND